MWRCRLPQALYCVICVSIVAVVYVFVVAVRGLSPLLYFSSAAVLWSMIAATLYAMAWVWHNTVEQQRI